MKLNNREIIFKFKMTGVSLVLAGFHHGQVLLFCSCMHVHLYSLTHHHSRSGWMVSMRLLLT